MTVAGDYWPCGSCHSLNVPAAERCYSCRTPRSTITPHPPAGEAPLPSAYSGGWPRPVFVGIVAVLAVGSGLFAGLLAVAAMSVAPTPAPPPQVVAVVTEEPPAATEPPTALATPPLTGGATATPAQSPSTAPAATSAAAPAATPAPAWIPYSGRFAGTWLLGEDVPTDAVAAGVYPRELVLRVRPRCTTGACAVDASLVDPRTGRTLKTATVKPTAEGYRIRIATSGADLCRGRDGRTVEAGAKRTTSFIVRPFVSGDGRRTILAGTGSIRLDPNRRGDSVGCQDSRVDIGVLPEQLDKAQVASVKRRLSPVPLPDLVPLPDFRVGIRGVRSVYYGVKGDRASVLMRRWAATSSKERHCGRIEHAWYTGSGQTSSCIKSSYSVRWVNRSDYWTGTCTVTGVRLRWSMTMPIARWTGPSLVPRTLIPWWKATQRYVRDHEAQHVAIYRQWSAVLPGRVVGRSCADAGAIVKKWGRQMHAAQEAFDRKDYARDDWPVAPSGVR